jgi:hypothetical protein
LFLRAQALPLRCNFKESERLMRWLLTILGLAAWCYATGDEDALIDQLIDEGIIDDE